MGCHVFSRHKIFISPALLLCLAFTGGCFAILIFEIYLLKLKYYYAAI